MKTRAKTAYEVRTYKFPFGVQPEFENGATISGIDTITSSPAGPTLTNAAVNGSDVYITLAGGTNANRYLIVARITLSDGSKLEAAGILSIVNPVLAAI